MTTQCKKLLSKGSGGRVNAVNEKPSVDAEGRNVPDSRESADCELDVSILADSPNLYKQDGESMSQDFIKYIPGERSSWLRKNYPKAFLVLTVIAERARWNQTKADLDGLQIGDAVLGRKDISEECGLTEDEARTALEKLEEFNYIETVFLRSESRNIQKRPIKIPIKGRVVSLKTSDVWEVERKINPQNIPQVIPSSSPRTRKRESKNIDKDLCNIACPTREARHTNAEKISFGRYVKLKKDEYDGFVSQHTKKFIDDLIVRMNDWIEAKGKDPYKVHAAAIRTWIRKGNEGKYSKPNQRPQNYEVDTRPVQYDNTLDFSEHT